MQKGMYSKSELDYSGPIRGLKRNLRQGVGLVILLLCSLTVSMPLTAQAPMRQAEADSLLFVLFQSRYFMLMFGWGMDTPCSGLRGEAGSVCKALIKVQAGRPSRIPSQVVDTATRIYGAEFGIRLLIGATSFPVTDLALGFPEYGYEDLIPEGRRALSSLVTKYPNWGPLWYGLAAVALDMDNRPDSALKLLALARRHGDVPTLLTQFMTTRALLRMGRADGRDSLAALLERPDADSLRTWVWAMLCGRPSPYPCNDDLVPTTLPRRELLAERLSESPWAYPLVMRSRRYPVIRPQGESQVFTISLLRQNLPHQEMETPHGKRYLYPLQVRLVAVREDGYRVVQDSLRNLATATRPYYPRYNDRGRIELLTELSLPPGRYDVGLFVRSENGGGAFELHHVEVPAAESGPLVATLVAGVPGQGTALTFGNIPIWLQPGGEWQRQDSVSLFSQFSGLTPGESYQVRLEFLPVPQAESPRAMSMPLDSARGVSISSTELARDSLVNWRRTLLRGSLRPGAWCARISLLQGDSVLSRRTEPLLVDLNYRSWPDFLEVNFVTPMPQACDQVRLLRLLGQEAATERRPVIPWN